jgi:hypothetical protein
VIYAVKVLCIIGYRSDPMPLLAPNSGERELPLWMVNEHDYAITPPRCRWVTGQDRLEVENPEVAYVVGLRRLGFFPWKCGVVEGEVVPAQLAGVVEDRRYVLDGGDGWESELLAGGRVEELELGAGVGGHKPTVG